MGKKGATDKDAKGVGIVVKVLALFPVKELVKRDALSRWLAPCDIMTESVHSSKAVDK